ncbi:MAG: ribonuclease III [Proteobacteria bacterium]|nr:ribonuclease III [Pseudomonadota bacterium]
MECRSQALWDIKPQLFSDLRGLEHKLGYEFRRKAWLYESLTHRSALVSEGLAEQALEDDRPWNERLEFLGDSVLGLTITQYLCGLSRSFSEGDMSRMRAALVCEESLANIAKVKLDLGSYLVLGQSELSSNGRGKNSLLANAFEAVIGAVFSDAGWEAARALVLRLFEEVLSTSLVTCLERDHKTVFQEASQAKFRVTPTYDVLSEAGPAHARLFEVAVYVENSSGREEWGRGSGTTKKRAAQVAAARAVERLKESHS